MSTLSLSTTELPEAETEEIHYVKSKCLFVTTATPCVALLTLPRPRSRVIIQASATRVGSLFMIDCLYAEVNVGGTANVCLFKVTIFDPMYYCSSCQINIY